MKNSLKQVLLVAIFVAIITGAIVYYANSNESIGDTPLATESSPNQEGTERTPAETGGLSIDENTDMYGPVPDGPTLANSMIKTVACLEEKGVVIYGSRTCPACTQMVTLFKGYEVIDPIYVECQTNGLRCSVEMQTKYVPEVQISGTLFQGPATPAAIAAAVGCPV